MKYLSLIFISLLLVQCSPSKEEQPNSSNTPAKTPSSQAPQGEFTKEYHNGTDVLKFEGHKSNGKPQGFCKIFYETGKVKIEANYNYGKLDGFYKSYFPNGVEKSSGHFKMGEKTGQWKHYDNKGNLLREENL